MTFSKPYSHMHNYIITCRKAYYDLQRANICSPSMGMATVLYICNSANKPSLPHGLCSVNSY